MSYSTAEIWLVIGLLAAGTFAIRFSFLGLIGDRDLPPVVLRLLRYTPVAILPGLAMPLVLAAPESAGWTADPLRLGAAAATLMAGWLTKNMLAAIGAGAFVFYGLGAVFGL
ncbi:AzlD domain-containing protein [Ovoidimarina sediminis]|uniref:AzlD domain-containing protein n=1 Tax=Ovoidimarina sediminis TaxID=3079856 RepID=UPI002912AD28|nr:AzlD domain-containing protein [Rhodophyticola sp. MJ-SS7]MDU8943514.1 AzlD domain-containing protein [Rhodophyticola sp. MJ-SS7]